MCSDAAAAAFSSCSSSFSLPASSKSSPVLQFSSWMWSAEGSIPPVYKSQCDVRGSAPPPLLLQTPILISTPIHPPTNTATSIHSSLSSSCLFSPVTVSSFHHTSLWHHKAKGFYVKVWEILVVSSHECTQYKVCLALPGRGCRGDVVGVRGCTTNIHHLYPCWEQLCSITPFWANCVCFQINRWWPWITMLNPKNMNHRETSPHGG